MRKGTFTTCVVVIIKKGYDQNFQFHLSENVLIHTRVWPDKSLWGSYTVIASKKKITD